MKIIIDKFATETIANKNKHETEMKVSIFCLLTIEK